MGAKNGITMLTSLFGIMAQSALKKGMTTMTQPQQNQRGPLVEDSTVVGGYDKNGAPVIKPKTPDGKADESVKPTDKREKADKK